LDRLQPSPERLSPYRVHAPGERTSSLGFRNLAANLLALRWRGKVPLPCRLDARLGARLDSRPVRSVPRHRQGKKGDSVGNPQSRRTKRLTFLADEITDEEYLDSDFKAGLQRTVKAELERALTGEETTKEVEGSLQSRRSTGGRTPPRYDRQPGWLREKYSLLKRMEDMPATIISWANGSTLQGVPKGADQIRQYHLTLLIVDEAAHVDDSEASHAAADPVCGQIIAVSSAAPGWFGDVVTQALEQSG